MTELELTSSPSDLFDATLDPARDASARGLADRKGE